MQYSRTIPPSPRRRENDGEQTFASSRLANRAAASRAAAPLDQPGRNPKTLYPIDFPPDRSAPPAYRTTSRRAGSARPNDLHRLIAARPGASRQKNELGIGPWVRTGLFREIPSPRMFFRPDISSNSLYLKGIAFGNKFGILVLYSASAILYRRPIAGKLEVVRRARARSRLHGADGRITAADVRGAP